MPARRVEACAQPDTWSMETAFDLAAAGLLPPSYPQLPASEGVRAIPSSLLKAVGWVESGWRQYSADDRPLVSSDFGYGIMQVTSGMAGAFGDAGGSVDPAVQSRIASDYRYNIAYGARLLALKWIDTPAIGNRDPGVIEDWYYALWAYNGWGWANNPNNPRFTRQGTPATNPSTYPYQERVLYLVAHPPHDGDGNPLWQPIPVALPGARKIGRVPGPLPATDASHRQDSPPLAADYRPAPLAPLTAGASEAVTVKVSNVGTQPWLNTGAGAVMLGYHVLTMQADPWQPLSPFSPGVVSYGQGVVALPRSLLPGHTVSIRERVVAPTQPGQYRIAWDVESGTGGWLSQTGVLPGVEPLRVPPPGSAAAPTPTATPTRPEPMEGLRYIADTSEPDGSTLASRQSFTKGWLVFNAGREAWGAGWALHLISGRSFGLRTIPLPPAAPCRSATVLAALRAPARAGHYRSVWQARDAAGRAFGNHLTLVVTVTASGGHPSPPPTPTPTPRPAPPTPTPTPSG